MSIAIEIGHEIVFQWIFSHCGVMDNEAAVHAAKMAHAGAQRLAVPFVAPDSNRLVDETGKSSFSLAPYSLAPPPPLARMRLIQSSHSDLPNLPRRRETVLHRLSLGDLFTGHNLFKIKQVPSPDCTACVMDETATCLIMDSLRMR